jgi:hypothetical protein
MVGAEGFEDYRFFPGEPISTKSGITGITPSFRTRQLVNRDADGGLELSTEAMSGCDYRLQAGWQLPDRIHCTE